MTNLLKRNAAGAGLAELTPSQIAALLDHELLTDLLGGDGTNGHYHLTQDKRNHVEQYWLPFQRTLTFNQTIDSNQSVVIQGPLTMNSHTVTIGAGAVLRILT